MKSSAHIFAARAGILLTLLLGAVPALAGTITVTGNLPRSLDTPFTFTVVVDGLTSAVDPDPTHTLVGLSITLPQFDSSLPIQTPALTTGYSTITGVEATENPPHAPPVQDATSAGVATYKIIYTIQITETSSNFLSTNAAKLTNGALTVQVDYKGNGETASNSTTPATLQQSVFVLTDAPTFGPIVGSEQSLNINWATPATVAALPGAPQAPSSVDVYVIDSTEVTTQTVTLPCMKFNAANYVATTPPAGTAATPIPPDTAASCTFTLPTTFPANCVSFPDVNPGTPKVSLDYLVPSQIIGNANFPGFAGQASAPYTAGAVTIPGLQNGRQYIVFLQYEPTGTAVSQCLPGTPAPNFTLTELNGEGDAKVVDFRCFIATAAYGSAMHPDLRFFRKFRNRVLLTNPVGKAFVHYYYKYSPPAADFIARHPMLRDATRGVLQLPLGLLKEFDEYY